MEVVRLCIDRHSGKEDDYDREYLLWEGNYWDDPVHDCTLLSLTTVEILVNKIAVVLRKYCGEEETVLLFLPQVIQLPLSILAGMKAGVTIIPLDPATCDDEKLNRVLLKGQPVLAITVDAYWLGQQLQETYKRFSFVLEGKSFSLRHVLVIRHTCPNPGVPPPEEHIPARRPYYLIEWSVKEGRDIEWSEEVRRVPNDVKFNSNRNDKTSPLVLLFNRDASDFRSLTEKELLEHLGKKSESFPQLVGPVLSLVHPESTPGLLAFLRSWSSGQPLVQYEGLLDYPDPSRIAHITRKYQVKSIVLPEAKLDIEYLRFVDIRDIQAVIAPMKMKETIQEAFKEAQFIPI